jgi:molecular chaperone GrpE (heat shock protein)
MKASVGAFIKSMDDLETAIATVTGEGKQVDASALLQQITSVRKHIAELDARIERTLSEWEDLKKNEIGIKTLETRIRHSLKEHSVQDIEEHGKDR